MADEIVVSIEFSDPGLQVRDIHLVLPAVRTARLSEIKRNKVHMLPDKRKLLYTVIAPVSNQHQRVVFSRVGPDAVRTDHVPRLRAATTPTVKIVAHPVVPVNPSLSIPIADIHIAVRCHCGVGWDVFVLTWIHL